MPGLIFCGFCKIFSEVKLTWLVCSQLSNNRLKFLGFTGEFLASGLVSLNKVSTLALFRGFILVNNFGESHLGIFLLKDSLLTSNILDLGGSKVNNCDVLSSWLSLHAFN